MYKLELLNSSIYILFPPFLSHVFGNILFLQVLQNVTLQLASQFKRKREKKRLRAAMTVLRDQNFLAMFEVKSKRKEKIRL